MVDVELLDYAVGWAEIENEKPAIDSEWYQGDWVKSAEDRAGSLAYEFVVETDGYDSNKIEEVKDVLAAQCGTSFCIAGYIGQALEPRYREGNIVDGIHVSDFARDALGITERQASRLFDGANGIDDVRNAAQNIKDGI